MSLPEIRCPAGHFEIDSDHGPGVYCGVERRHISAIKNPKSVMGYCSDAYDKCPAWIAERDNDPAADAAKGTPRMRRCPDCDGTGADTVEVLQSGMWVVMEFPCDLCVGTGRVVDHPDLDREAAEDELFIERLQRAYGARGQSTVFLRGDDG